MSLIDFVCLHLDACVFVVFGTFCFFCCFVLYFWLTDCMYVLTVMQVYFYLYVCFIVSVCAGVHAVTSRLVK